MHIVNDILVEEFKFFREICLWIVCAYPVPFVTSLRVSFTYVNIKSFNEKLSKIKGSDDLLVELHLSRMELRIYKSISVSRPLD